MLLTVAAVAVVLALMIEPDAVTATFSLIGVTVVSLAFIAIGVVYGADNMRAFCIGAAFPLTMSFGYAVFNMQSLLILEPFSVITSTDPRLPAQFMGTMGLASIALGYLCVAFRWIIAPPEDKR